LKKEDTRSCSQFDHKIKQEIAINSIDATLS